MGRNVFLHGGPMSSVDSHYYLVGQLVTVHACEPTEVWKIVKAPSAEKNRMGYWVVPVGDPTCNPMLVMRGQCTAYIDPEAT